MRTKWYKKTEFSLSFVLKGWLEGERGVLALYSDGDGGGPMEDGWYYGFDDGSGMSFGPYASREGAEEAAMEFIDDHTE